MRPVSNLVISQGLLGNSGAPQTAVSQQHSPQLHTHISSLLAPSLWEGFEGKGFRAQCCAVLQLLSRSGCEGTPFPAASLHVHMLYTNNAACTKLYGVTS